MITVTQNTVLYFLLSPPPLITTWFFPQTSTHSFTPYKNTTHTRLNMILLFTLISLSNSTSTSKSAFYFHNLSRRIYVWRTHKTEWRLSSRLSFTFHIPHSMIHDQEVIIANTNEIPITLSVPIGNLEDFEEQECYKQIKNLHNFKHTNYK